MRVGDIILNRSAGKDNPERYSVFLRWQGNEAVCVALANNVVRIVRWDKYDVQHDGKFEVVGQSRFSKSCAKAFRTRSGRRKRGMSHE